MRKNNILGFLAIVVFILCAVQSCKKVEETIATITVLDADNEPEPGVNVRLYAFGTGENADNDLLRFDTTQVTNAAGVVSFDFTEFYERGQSGFAVLDVMAWKGGSMESPQFLGESIIKIEEEMESEETVKLLPN